MSSRDEGAVTTPRGSGVRTGDILARGGARIPAEEAKTQILRLLDARLSGDATERWFKHMQLVAEDANQVTVLVPTFMFVSTAATFDQDQGCSKSSREIVCW